MKTKHHLVLVALLSLGSGWAGAQSNTTLFGLIDANVGRFKGAATGINAKDAALYRADSGGMSTSHFGVRGTEDLGGGLLAQFELSGFMRNDVGSTGRGDAIGAPVNVASDPLWSRASWVGIGEASLGRVRVGNATTQLFLQAITSNAFGDSTVFGPLNLVTFIGSPLSGGTGWTNSVVYDSPQWAGFNFAAAHSLSEGQGGHNASLRAAYTRGAFAASFAWQDVEKNPTTFADGTSANNTRAWQLAASYDFGVLKLFGHLGRIDNRGTETAPLSVGYQVWDLSLSAPLGSGNLLAGYALRRTSDLPAPVPATAAGGNLRRAVFTLGYDHYLSKRTDLYLMAMQDSTETRTLPAPPSILKASGQSVGAGIRHRF